MDKYLDTFVREAIVTRSRYTFIWTMGFDTAAFGRNHVNETEETSLLRYRRIQSTRAAEPLNTQDPLSIVLPSLLLTHGPTKIQQEPLLRFVREYRQTAR